MRMNEKRVQLVNLTNNCKIKQWLEKYRLIGRSISLLDFALDALESENTYVALHTYISYIHPLYILYTIFIFGD